MRRSGLALCLALICTARLALAAPPRLTLYSSLAYAAPVARAFTKATSIPVRVVTAPGADLLAHIMAQGAHPRWSLAWFNDAASAVTLDHAGLLAHHLPLPPDLTKLGKALTSPDGAWVPTGLTLAGILVAAANPYLTPPDHWAALTGGAYHGIIGMDDPQLTRATFAALAGLLQANGGWPEGKSFMSNLKHDGLHIYADDADTLAALRSGAIQLAIVNSSVATDYAQTRDRSLRLAYPRPVFAMPSLIVMARPLPTKRQAAALRFIAFVNRPAIQALRMRAGGDGWYWPITSQPAPPTGLPPLASLDVRILDARYWGRLQPRIIAWFNRRIVGPGN
jgi:iron(III) transport system substrate-binding protein